MKIVVAGKGGAGKTTVSGTIARALARAGNPVLALDADANPMLGVSLGVGFEKTDMLNSVRQALDAGEVEHEPTVEGMVESFGTDAPDGVRLVVASRIDNDSPGCQCCGVSPDQILRELEHEYRVVICDLEAGIGTVSRMSAGNADVVVVVANPTAKALEVARRAIEIASDVAEVVVLANRVRSDEDLKAITDVVGDRELIVIPEDPVIAAADRDGVAPIDLDPESPGVAAIIKLADRLAGAPVPA
ncbi:MAG TPA: AAA family ATPase [Thermoleophilaceae bacterium]|nr:AAA family ATPase [Thermoleophilaceae bacterium]